MRLLLTFLLSFSISVCVAQVDSLMNIGRGFAVKRDYENALLYFNKAIVVSKSNTDKGKVLNNIGLLYSFQKEFNKSIESFNRSIHHYKLDSNKEKIARAYLNVGSTYRRMSKFDSAKEAYDKAFSLAITQKTRNSALNNIGRLLLSTGEYKKGIVYFKDLVQKSDPFYQIHQNLAYLYAKTDQIDSAAVQYGKALVVHQSKTSPVYIELKKEIADMFYTAGKKDEALAVYIDAMDAYERLRDLYLIDQTKLKSSDTNKDIYLSAIECAAKTKQFNKMLALMERLKAPVLSEKIHMSNLPDSIQTRIKEYDHDISKALGSSYKDLDKLIHKKEVLLQRYTIDDSEPFTNALYSLADDMAILNYTYSDSLLIRSISIKGESSADVLPIDLALEAHAVNYHFKIADLNATSYDDYLNYFRSSKELCKYLLPELPDSITRLLIIPYDKLYLVPFACLTESDPHKDWASFYGVHYLIQDYAISYAPSLGTIRVQTNSNTKALAFVPSYADSIQLKYADQEAKALKKHYSTDIIDGAEANRETFFKALPGHDIISIISHGENGKIFLQNDTILADDLYKLNLDNALTVLSACQSSAGRLQSTEGFMSLARKFLELGSRSVIASVWEANDKVTADIMSGFYLYTAEGDTKDVALQKAMINHLDNAESVLRAPGNWSAPVLMGNVESLPKSRSKLLWLLLLFVLVPFSKYFKCRS
jgi:tetratricopeptide (TPR) repeat protein